MYKNELDKILDASHKGALSLFVGAGVSALSNAPTWKGLIDAICRELGHDIKDHYSFDECLQYPQMYYYSINEDSSVCFWLKYNCLFFSSGESFSHSACSIIDPYPAQLTQDILYHACKAVSDLREIKNTVYDHPHTSCSQ